MPDFRLSEKAARRIKTASKLLGGFALLLVLLSVLAGLWLRSDSAKTFVFSHVKKILAEQGLDIGLESFGWGEFFGPLPQRLELKGLSLADPKGVFLQAESFSLGLDLSSFIGGVLDVRLAELRSPVLYRLPEFSPSQPEEKEAEKPSSGNFLESLPFDMKLARLTLENGRVYERTITGTTEGEALEIGLSGEAELASGRLSANLQVFAREEDGSGFELALSLPRLAATSGPEEDRLDLRLAVRAAPGSLFLRVLNAGGNAVPAYALSLYGSGGVKNWRARLQGRVLPEGKDVPALNSLTDETLSPDFLNAPDFPGESDDIYILRADIGLRAMTGNLLADFVNNPQWSLQLDAAAGLGFRSEQYLRDLLGGNPRLRAGLAALGRNISGTAKLESWRWNLSLPEISLQMEEGGGLGLTLEAHALIPDFQDLGVPGVHSLPLRSVEFSGRFALSAPAVGAAGLEAGGFCAVVPLDGLLPGNEAQRLDYFLSIAKNEKSLDVNALKLEGLGLSVTGEAAYGRQGGPVKGRLAVNAAEGGFWQLAAASFLAGTEAEKPFGGKLNLTVDFDVPPVAVNLLSERGENGQTSDEIAPSLPSDGVQLLSFDLSGQDLLWPDRFLSELLGNALHLQGELRLGDFSSGNREATGQGSDRADSGAQKPERGAFSLILAEADSGGLSLKGRAAYLPPFRADGAVMENARLRGGFALRLKDIKALSGDFSGPLALDLNFSGTPGDLKAALKADAPNISGPGGEFKQGSLQLDMVLRDKAGPNAPAQNIDLSGRLSASVGSGPAGPMLLEVDWQSLVAENKTAFSLRNLRLSGAGLDMDGEVNGELGGGSGPPVSRLAMNGRINASLERWEGLSAVLGRPLRGGPAKFTADMSSGGGRQKVSARFSLDDFSLPGPSDPFDQGSPPLFSLRKAEGRLEFAGTPQAPEIDFTLQSGSGLAGLLRWQNSSLQVRGDAENGVFTLVMQDRLKGAPGKTGGQYERAGCSGVYSLKKSEAVLNKFSLSFPEKETGLKLSAPARLSFSQGFSLKGLQLELAPGGTLRADADFSGDAFNVAASLRKFSLKTLALLTDSPLPGGVVNLALEASGKGQSVRGAGTIEALLDDGHKGGEPLALALRADLSPDPLASLGGAGFGLRRVPGIFWLNVNGGFGQPVSSGSGQTEKSETGPAPVWPGTLAASLPLRLNSGFPAPESGVPLGASLKWEGPISRIWQAVPLPDRFLSGRSILNARIHGTLNAPRTQAEFFLADGQYEDHLLGILLTDINIEAASKPEEPFRAVLSAADGKGGTLALQGLLSSGSSPEGELSLRGQFNHLSPLQREDLSLMLSGIFSVNGQLSAPEITATLEVERGEFQILPGMSSSVRTLEIEGGTAEAAEPDAGPLCDISINIPRQFFIRGMGLESEWGGLLRLEGPLKKPALTGSLKPVRGYLDILSKTFTFAGGEITFAGGGKINPGINLELVYENSGFEAVIKAGGSASKPTLALESRPPLPQDEVLSRVLFGKDVSSLSRFEMIQLAAGLRDLAGGGGAMNPLAGMRKTLGLDVLRLGSADQEGDDRRSSVDASALGAERPGGKSGGGEAAPTLEAGKYVNDSIYIGVEQGATQDSTGVRVEVELLPNLNLEGRTTSTSSEIGIGWKKDY